MKTWLNNGANVAWLIDPVEKQTHIFKAGSDQRTITGFDKIIDGEGPISGFRLDLSLLTI